jgi:hypothetical protein
MGGLEEGDPAYAWTIAFPPGSTRNCVVYSISGQSCSVATSASFYIARAAVMDSAGGVDELVVGRPLTIGSEFAASLPLSLGAVGNRFLIPGRENTVRIRGNGFTPSSIPRLRCGDAVLPSIRKELVSSEGAKCVRLDARAILPLAYSEFLRHAFDPGESKGRVHSSRIRAIGNVGGDANLRQHVDGLRSPRARFRG